MTLHNLAFWMRSRQPLNMFPVSKHTPRYHLRFLSEHTLYHSASGFWVHLTFKSASETSELLDIFLVLFETLLPPWKKT